MFHVDANSRNEQGKRRENLSVFTAFVASWDQAGDAMLGISSSTEHRS